MIPHKCPVCDGTGLVSKPPWVAGDQSTWVTTELGPYPCKSCGGTGIIWTFDAPVCPEPEEKKPGEGG